jgi:hypothetical protein
MDLSQLVKLLNEDYPLKAVEFASKEFLGMMTL